jgi:hypothetical protein
MHTDETTATSWVDGVGETLYESFKAGESVTLPGFGGFYVRSPPPENRQFNYIIDIFGKWYRSYFYFCGRYYCPGPNAISPTFETRFTVYNMLGMAVSTWPI